MSQKVVVGFSGTGSSMEATRWAADEATVRHAALRIVCCFEIPQTDGAAALDFGVGAAYDAVRSTAETNAETIREAIGASHPALMPIIDVGAGPAPTVLLEGLDHDDLVVVGASSHAGPAAFWVGTTVRSVVHHSPCPVAVVRRSVGRGTPDRVVVGIDGSPASASALRWAGDEAERHGVELVVVHAWDYPYGPADIASAHGRDLTGIDAARTLDSAVEAARERCAAVVTPKLVEGGPVTALLDTARGGDILVVGSRGRGALRSRFFGSTANSVLDAAVVPVVIIRADPTGNEAAPLDEPALASI